MFSPLLDNTSPPKAALLYSANIPLSRPDSFYPDPQSQSGFLAVHSPRSCSRFARPGTVGPVDLDGEIRSVVAATQIIPGGLV